MSTALCRANTPGAGSGALTGPNAIRRSDSSRWVGLGISRSRWASTIAPSAAVISSAPVISNAQTNLPKISPARAVMFPPSGAELTASSPTAAPNLTPPSTPKIITMNPAPSSAAAKRCPRIVSTSESEESTPTSISTNRNSIITAPV